MIKPTRYRGFYDQGHQPPSSKHSGGRADTFNGWPGTSKEHNRAARRRRYKLSWRKILAEARRESLAKARRES